MGVKMEDKKHFIKISSDDMKGIEEFWFENQDRFHKFGCVISFDKESSKECNESWSEELSQEEVDKLLN